MAVTLAGSTTSAIATSGSATPSIPGTPQEGDVVIVVASVDGPFALTAPTDGSTPYDAVFGPLAAGVPSVGVWYKIMGSTPDSTVSLTGSSQDSAWIVLTFRGVDIVNGPFIEQPVVNYQATGDPTPLPIIGKAGSGAILSCGFLDDVNATSVTQSGATDVVFIAAGGTAGSTSTTMIGWQPFSAYGIVSPSAFVTDGDDENVAITIALKAQGSRTAQTVFLTSTGAGTWTVPDDFDPAANSVECIGGGGGGDTPSTTGGGGGGSSAYASGHNFSLTPGASINYSVGAGGTANGGNGGNSFFNATSLANAISNGSSVSVGADGGNGTGTITGGTAGTAGASVGVVTYSGAAGANGGNATSGGGGGGAGSAGPSGAGKTGGAGAAAAQGCGGGGGGSNGGFSSVGAPGNSSTNGGAGGNGYDGTGSGANGDPASAGTNGGGGGGSDNNGGDGPAGGTGGPSIWWTQTSDLSTAGPGGGAGGGDGGAAGGGNPGGQGGLYGGGGGGAGDTSTGTQFSGGVGRQGIIVISYLQVNAARFRGYIIA